MDYSDLYEELKSVFNENAPEIPLPGGMTIRNIEFRSAGPGEGFANPGDPAIPENFSFSYPVFCPANSGNKVILLLHGLNERSWIKYLAWAYTLSERCSAYVVLFPISFHINRTPETWRNPRAMTDYLTLRNTIIGKVSDSSFANIALSNRLTDDPLRFFYSGHQTVNDIVSLFGEVNSGSHPVIPAGCRVDIFAYSIGAFLSQILMMGNPENLFSGSKLFLFCGGSVFSRMNGSSKLIMDQRAFERVYSYYLNDFEGEIKGKNSFSEFLHNSRVGLAFRSMIDTGRLINFRESLLEKLREQISIVALEKDTVIPVPGILDTMKASRKKNIVRVMDFPYQYAHENPFPILKDSKRKHVDSSFSQAFDLAAGFLE